MHTALARFAHVLLGRPGHAAAGPGIFVDCMSIVDERYRASVPACVTLRWRRRADSELLLHLAAQNAAAASSRRKATASSLHKVTHSSPVFRACEQEQVLSQARLDVYDTKCELAVGVCGRSKVAMTAT